MDIPTVVREKALDFEESKLREYVNKVFDFLQKMKPGDDIRVNKLAKEDTRDLFLEVCKFYMRQHDYQDGLSFSKNYERIYKYDITFLLRPKGIWKYIRQRNNK